MLKCIIFILFLKELFGIMVLLPVYLIYNIENLFSIQTYKRKGGFYIQNGYLQREKIGLREGVRVLSLFGRFNFYLFRKINTNTFSELYCKYGKILFAPVSSPKSEWHKMKQYPVQTPKLTRKNLEIKSLKEVCNTTFSISWNLEDWNWFNLGKSLYWKNFIQHSQSSLSEEMLRQTMGQRQNWNEKVGILKQNKVHFDRDRI